MNKNDGRCHGVNIVGNDRCGGAHDFERSSVHPVASCHEGLTDRRSSLPARKRRLVIFLVK